MKLSTDWSAYAPTRTLNDLTLWVETDRKKLEDRSGRDQLPVMSAWPRSCCASKRSQLRRFSHLTRIPPGGETLMSPSWLGNIGNIGKCPTGGGGWVSLLTLPPCHPGGWEKMSEHCLLQNQDHENKSVCLGIFQLQAKGANL